MKKVMRTKLFLPIVIWFCLFMFVSYRSFANNIIITNLSLTDQNMSNHYIMVKFDINWENSWRTYNAPNNWDAAWVFVKYRIGTGTWKHSWLNNSGHINPTGSTITIGLLDQSIPFNQTTNPGLGAFIYRDSNGIGIFSKSNVQLRWNYGANGVADNAVIDICVYAIEMVYVPKGSFSVGSGGTEVGAFYKYPTTTNPFQITSEDPIIVGTENDNLNYSYSTYSGDHLGPIPITFPKGYYAFYCMKYEISQQGYVDFLNSLTQAQADARKYTGSSYRYGINGTTAGSYVTTNPFLACNFLNWTDIAAYLDWSGLRPMTELELEKSCRGTLTSVPNEYAWGTTGIANSPYSIINSGTYTENIASNYSIIVGNATFNITTPINGSINGPVRVGIFAGNELNTGRITSGATYYGIMEMSGNVWERSITVGNPEGRSYTGMNGNGVLDISGNADVLHWPGTSGVGAGFRCGVWVHGFGLQVSDRINAAHYTSIRYYDSGGRGVRTAP